MASDNLTTPRSDRGFKLISIREEQLDRKIALAFGFMSFLPILIIVWARLTGTDIMLAVFGIAVSVFIGYFAIVRRIVDAIIQMNQRAKELSSGRVSGEAIAVQEGSEIGELARAFNRITGELQHKIDELEVSREQVKRLLSRIGTAIVSYSGIDTLLNIILEHTVSALGAQRGSLLLVDGEKRELYVKTSWSANGDMRSDAPRVKLGEGIAGWVAEEGRPMRDTGKPSVLGFRDGPEEPGAILCVPLKLREQPMGVVMILRQRVAEHFTDDEVALVTSISSQIAVAIENYRLNLDVERTYIETIRALALAVEAKDPYSAGHSKRVGYYATQIGEMMGLDEEMLHVLNDAGVLHDIGKIGIKDEILLKPSRLTSEEQKIMEQHSVIGNAILQPVRSLGKVAPLVLHHHEHYDGTGYPSGLKGEDIPLGSRILAAADTYDAMVTDRPYRERLPVEEAMAELKRYAGVHLDSVVVEAFLKVIQEKEQRRSGTATPVA